MSSQRTLYSTQVKLLAREGLLPSHILEQIPRSNIHRWKNEVADKYKGYGLEIDCNHEYEIIKAFAHNKMAKRVFSAYVRLIRLLLDLAHPIPGFRKAVKEYRFKIVDLPLRIKKDIGINRMTRMLNISIPTLKNWMVQTNTKCFESLTRHCYRIFPNQLSKSEVLKIKDLLVDPKFQYWPVSSIAHHALRTRELSISLNTWYKYVHKLGLGRIRPNSRKKKNTVGIRANSPHQVWHADITIFESKDRIKSYIYLVVDNFSRKIIAWKVANEIKSEIRKQTIVDALQNSMINNPVSLITDGGAENKFSLPVRFEKHIEHEIALLSVHYSNSLVESHNKLIKYNYLYKMEIEDRQQLSKAMEFIVDDFNNRPHVSLQGLTPNEVEAGASFDKCARNNQIMEATRLRKANNQVNQCNHCS